MIANRYHTAPPPSSGRPDRLCPHFDGWWLGILVLFLLSGVTSLNAQGVPADNEWRFDTINAIVGFDLPSSYNARVSFDPYGVRHHTWVSRDPTSAGLQIYHSDNATGRIGAPFLLSDTGTVYDSLDIDTLSYLTLPDRQGILHTLFLANVPEVGGLDIGLYYVNNRELNLDRGIPVRLTTESARYAMAVDSLGRTHVIWLLKVPGGIEVRYWNSDLQPGQDYPLDTIPSSTFPPRIGDPVLEVSGQDIHFFVRNDSGVIYHGRSAMDGSSKGQERLLFPAGLQGAGFRKPVDFSLRGAVDVDGAWHLLVPLRGNDLLLQLYYVTNADGVERSTMIGQADSTILGYDIRTSGDGRIGAVWSRYRGRFFPDVPKTSYLELRRAAPGVWIEEERIDDINDLTGNPDNEWRIANHLDISADRVAIALLRRPANRSIRHQGIGYYLRRSPELTVRSLIPDAGAPGMSLVVEFYGDYRDRGLFGVDTLDPQNVWVETVNPADASRLIVGPSVVSWDGRLLSTMLFIDPEAPPGPVPLKVLVHGEPSSEVTFYIVEPQHLGDKGDGHLRGGGVLGSGGSLGERTPGGVIVVDSLFLSDGTYYVSTEDIDPVTPGNEGMFPVTILARGGITIDSTATLSISAQPPFLPAEFGAAGPGGGGGGGGMGEGGGEGFTGGGLPGDSLRSSVALGSGSLQSSISGGGASHVNTPGGAGMAGAPGGGGTGHPYGVSGRYGRREPLYPLRADEAGIGGGGGGYLLENSHSTGGGGGGHGARGEHGSPITRNGGEPSGSPVLVPISGGSGGGGGISLRGHAAGGGGGGALALYAERSLALFGKIEANGADGYTGQVSFNTSGGGGGSGGGVLIGAQGGIVLGAKGSISVLGGAGATAHGPEGEPGGDGGVGRVRVDGRVDLFDSSASFDRLSAGYFALATDMSGSFQVDDSVEVTGTGTPGRRIRLYARRTTGAWTYDAPQETVVDEDGVWKKKIAPGGSGRLYVAAMEQVERVGSPEEWREAPSWIMSTAGGLIVGTPAARISVGDVDFGCVDYGSCDTARVYITNTGTQSDLFISNPEIVGGNGWFIIGEFSPLRIPPGTTASILLRFCPADSGSRQAFLRFVSNSRPDSLHIVDLSGCGRAGELRYTGSDINLGPLCPGDCRDTVVQISNVGNAPLEVNRLVPGDGRIAVEVLSTPLPLRLDPGESASVRVRVCLRGGSGNFTASFQGTTPFAPTTIRFLIQNQGPQVEVPTSTPLLLRDRGKADTCPLLKVRLRNLRSDAPLRIAELLPRSPYFTVVSPTAGTTVGPLEEIEVLLRFCAENTGEYGDTLDLQLESGPCRIDTIVPLRGRVIRSLPELSLSPDEKIDFGDIPVARSSFPRSVRVRNTGDGWGRGITYRLEGIAPATAGEFSVLADFTQPEDLKGNSEFKLDVTAIPATTGLRSGRLIVQNQSGSWVDTVDLCATGIEPGVVPDTTLLVFPGVRRGTASTRELRIFNLGNGADWLERISLDDSTRFRIIGLRGISTTSSLPALLSPDEDTLVVTIDFRSDEVGIFSDTLHGYTREGTEVRVILTALSGLEQGAVDRNIIRFTCDSTGMAEETVTVTNTGSWELKVTRLLLEGASPGSFRVLDMPGPDLIPPGESRTYRVAYQGGESPVTATLRVEHSGPGILTARLEGGACTPEVFDISLVVPDLTGTINSPVSIPLQLLTPAPLPEEMTLQVALRYDPRNLMPRESGAVRGKLGTGVSGSEVMPGEVVVEMKIPAGTEQGILLEVDMTVLLGSSYRTPIDIEILPSVIPSRYAVRIEDGSVTTIDCDTSGTIDLGGIYTIRQSHPNPGGGIVRIPFEIARNEQVTITLYNARGDLERVLLDAPLEAGAHELTLDVSTLSAGLYYYEIRSGRYREVRRMVVRN